MTQDPGARPAVPVPRAVLFPGQGVDPVEAVRLVESHPDHPLRRHLDSVTGHRAWVPADLADTRLAQPVVVAGGLIAVEEAGLVVGPGSVVAGHSLGEITAMAFAGVFGATDAIDLVVARADLGHAAHQERPGMMVAALKLDAAAVEWARRRALAERGGVLETAVVNGPAQHVVSGDEATARRFADLIADAGGVPRRLGIGGAFHSPLLAGAVDGFTARVLALSPQVPRCPVVCSTAGVVVRDAAAVAQLLGRALVMPVDWVRAMVQVRDLGRTEAVDAGPGQTLVNLASFTPVLHVVPVAGVHPPG